MTPVMKLILPCDFLCDALHMCSEGISKDRLRDMFSSGSKFPELKVDNGTIKKLKHSLMGTSFHTYSNSIVLSLEDLPICKATEVDELAFVAFPLSVAVGAIHSPVARKLGRTLEMKDEGTNQESAQSRGRKLYKVLEDICAEPICRSEHHSHGVEEVAATKKSHKFSASYVLVPLYSDADFAQDALGYGQEELVPGFEGDLEMSSFYESLGSNEEERRKELSQRRQERAEWRPHLYQALQKALRDVRASKYEENDKSWIPSNKQKRKTVAVPEEDIEGTSNRQKRKALVEAAEDNIEMIDDVSYLRL